MSGALRHAEGSDFPADAYDAAERRLQELTSFVDDEGARLREKILHTGGLEPGRVRRG